MPKGRNLLLAASIVLALGACHTATPTATLSIPTSLPAATLSIAPLPSPTSTPNPTSAPTRLATTGTSPEYEFHVAVNGSDANPGTPDRPFATIDHARQVVRSLSSRMQGTIIVTIHGGVYPIRETLRFASQDSGHNGLEILYRAAEEETPILSGGLEVTGWRSVLGGSLWSTNLGEVRPFRQLYVNGLRAARAASEAPITGVRWADGQRSGIVIPRDRLPSFSRPQDLELHWIYDWKDMRLLVDSVDGTDADVTTIWMKQPYYYYALGMERETHHWIPRYDVPFYLENAPELIDKPGEWYYNPDSHQVLYWPREGEDMSTATVVIPQTQLLMSVAGNRVGEEVHDLTFEGLTFAYAGWPTPSLAGSFGWQAQVLIVDEQHEAMTPSHVQLKYSRQVRLERCRFEHLGAVGLSLENDVSGAIVRGNLFRDISDAAITVGRWDQAYITSPATQAVPHDNLIANNLIEDVGVEFWGAPAITAYYVDGLKIIHNEINNVPYTGVSLGWGWSSTTDSTTAHDNLVQGNLITNLMLRANDGGGIYTLGQQPGTRVDGNVIRRVGSNFACLYPDEGSAFITFSDNVCDTAPQWLHLWSASAHDIGLSNTYTNVRDCENEGTGIAMRNTVYVDAQSWPQQAVAIMEAAGLEPEYGYLRSWIAP
jgi:hypothetical protein